MNVNRLRHFPITKFSLSHVTVFKPTKNSFILEREQNLIWSGFFSVLQGEARRRRSKSFQPRRGLQRALQTNSGDKKS